MGNTIKIKHGTSIPTTESLAEYELGYCTENGGLYIGKPNEAPQLINVPFPKIPLGKNSDLRLDPGGQQQYCTIGKLKIRKEYASWRNARLLLAVCSRRAGTGIIAFTYGFNNDQAAIDAQGIAAAYANINYFGTESYSNPNSSNWGETYAEIAPYSYAVCCKIETDEEGREYYVFRVLCRVMTSGVTLFTSLKEYEALSEGLGDLERINVSSTSEDAIKAALKDNYGTVLRMTT